MKRNPMTARGAEQRVDNRVQGNIGADEATGLTA